MRNLWQRAALDALLVVGALLAYAGQVRADPVPAEDDLASAHAIGARCFKAFGLAQATARCVTSQLSPGQLAGCAASEANEERCFGDAPLVSDWIRIERDLEVMRITSASSVSRRPNLRALCALVRDHCQLAPTHVASGLPLDWKRASAGALTGVAASEAASDKGSGATLSELAASEP